jgi:hypothetical protein
LGSPLQLKGKNSQAWVCFGREQNKDWIFSVSIGIIQYILYTNCNLSHVILWPLTNIDMTFSFNDNSCKSIQ